MVRCYTCDDSLRVLPDAQEVDDRVGGTVRFSVLPHSASGEPVILCRSCLTLVDRLRACRGEGVDLLTLREALALSAQRTAESGETREELLGRELLALYEGVDSALEERRERRRRQRREGKGRP